MKKFSTPIGTYMMVFTISMFIQTVIKDGIPILIPINQFFTYIPIGPIFITVMITE